ncbi:MAG TPA: SpoIIE family protein phosphatase [Terriglobales bacterium]|nr:SpoIIE family protein phosphatase [Terriglobales bacterium]
MPSFFQSRRTPSLLSLEPRHTDVPELRSAELAAVYYGQRMAGDFYDFIRVSPNRVLFGLLDVAGRHEESRAILAAAQETFRTVAMAAFAQEEVNEATALVDLCIEINRTILRAAGGVRSCPAFTGCYHEDLGTVCYVNAGHTPALLRHSTGITEIGATGLPFGLFSHATCDAPTIAVEPNAALLLVSRGVVEAKCKGNEFGLEGVKRSLQKTNNENARDLCVGVLSDVKEFMCTPPTHNDVTALTLLRGAAANAVATSN